MAGEAQSQFLRNLERQQVNIERDIRRIKSRLSTTISGSGDVFITGASTHGFLSTTHLDTLPAGPLRGALVVGNSTPKWSRLATGAAGSILYGDGTDSLWTINPRVAGYFRVGSAAAPTNVTAGDATAVRMFVPVVIGSPTNAPSGTLTLQSTINATKGLIIFGAAGVSAYDEVTDRLGIGTSAPSIPLHIVGAGAITTWARIGSASAPTNTTAGDFTAIRIAVGNVAFASGLIVQISGGALGILAQEGLRLYDGDNSNYIEHKANATRTTNITYIWPATDPTASQVLSASAPVAGVSTLSWSTGGPGGSGAAAYVVIPFGSVPVSGQDYANSSGSTAYIAFGVVQRLINPDDFSFSPLHIVFEVHLKTQTAGKRALARLWDVSAGAAVGDYVETLSLTSVRLRSEFLTLPSADHVYRIEFGGPTAGTYTCYDAILMIGNDDLTAGFHYAILQMVL